jgi:hypothetical protein
VVTRAALSDFPKLYETNARMFVIGNLQGTIKQIVLPSFHLKWIFRAERKEVTWRLHG